MSFQNRAVTTPSLVAVSLSSVRRVRRRSRAYDPQALDLDRLADPWRDNPIANACIHPGQLEARLTSGNECVVIHPNAVACACGIAFDDLPDRPVEDEVIVHAHGMPAARGLVEECRNAMTNQSEPSTALNSGACPESGKRFGSIPSDTASAQPRRISRATSSRPVSRQMPGSAMKVSRPQSVNHG